MQSTPTLKETDPHDVFAIESILAGRADRAPPRAHDAAGAPAVAPPVHVAPGISPNISSNAPAPQIEPTFRATDIRDIQVGNAKPDEIKPDEIKVEALKALDDRPASRWGKRIAMALLGLCGAVAAAAWQHYGDQAKAVAVAWAPPFVLAALAPSDNPPAAEQANAPAVQAALADQSAVADPATAPSATPAQPEQAVAPAAIAAASESTQLQSMTQDLAAMSQQVEELKASIAQLKASQAQMVRELAMKSENKASEARVPEVKPSEPGLHPRATAAATPAPRPAAAPPRKPKPAYPPAEAAYVPPPAPAQPQPAPPPPPQQTMADDGAPIVRPPMPLR